MGIVDWIQQNLSETLCYDKDLYLFDGFPIPICHIKRYKRKGTFKGLASVGAAKDYKYFGFKGHLMTSFEGVTKRLSVTPAHIDERDILPEGVEGLTGDIHADKELIRPKLTENLKKGLHLHTPLRKNIKDSRPKGGD